MSRCGWFARQVGWWTLLDSEGGGRRLGEEFADIIARDLDLSGLFKVIDRGAYIEGPAGLSLEEINFQNWSVLGALALVKDGFSLDGDGVTVEVRLFDVAQHKQLGGKRCLQWWCRGHWTACGGAECADGNKRAHFGAG